MKATGIVRRADEVPPVKQVVKQNIRLCSRLAAQQGGNFYTA